MPSPTLSRVPVAPRSAAASCGLDDDLLFAAARAGDEAATNLLLRRHRGLALAKARSYFLVGADRDDVVQEAMIGLYKAIRDFDPSYRSSFATFADLCVTRQILTAIKAASRHKHSPLNSYVSFSRPVAADGGDEWSLAEILPSVGLSDPVDLLISEERAGALRTHVAGALSALEAEVLRLYVDGKSYVEIARELDRQVKTIDNALQRIKRKIGGRLIALDLADVS